MDNPYRINRGLDLGCYHLRDVFPDILSYKILTTIFTDRGEPDRVIKKTKVCIADIPHEMSVDNNDGSITVGQNHLRCSSDEFLYLDIIHELCHVKQHMDGRDLYDDSKSYVDRQTEIEAYEITVREARRIGLDDKAILDYLRVFWITPEEHERLARRLGVKVGTDQVNA